MPRRGETRNSTSQIRSVALRPSGATFVWVEATPITSNEIVASTQGRILGETPKSTQVRSGGKRLVFDPPRLRSAFSISGVQLHLPPLSATFAGPAEPGVNAKGLFGWLASIVIGGVTLYSEPISPFSFKVSATEKATTGAPSLAQQLQFDQTLAVGPGESLELMVDAYYDLEENNSGTNMSIECPAVVSGVKIEPSITSTINYDLSTLK